MGQEGEGGPWREGSVESTSEGVGKGKVVDGIEEGGKEFKVKKVYEGGLRGSVKDDENDAKERWGEDMVNKRGGMNGKAV